MRRGGFQLAELLVALGLAAGPMLVALGLIHSNMHGARFNQDRGTARMVLVDMVELLLGETTPMLRELCGVDGEHLLANRLADRIAHMPPAARDAYRAQVAPFSDALRCTLEEDVEGQPGLARLTLQVTLGGGATVEVRRLFRPASRPASM